MNEGMLAGVVCGVIVGIILVMLIFKMTKKDGSMKCKYDERQNQVRGWGFKYGFYTLIIYDMAYGMIDMVIEKPFIESYAAMFIGMMLAVSVYVAYCIKNEGYYALNENPKRVTIAFVILGVLNAAMGIWECVDGNMIEEGVLTARCTNLLCGLIFLVLAAVTFVKWRENEREAE